MDDRGYYAPPPDLGPLPPAPAKTQRKRRKHSPQTTVQQFWAKFNSQHPGKVFNVLPSNPYAQRKAAAQNHIARGQYAARSYDEARADCVRNVDRIIRECLRTNQKYRDPHFDIEWDLKSHQRNCLDGLSAPGEGMKPKGVKRVTDVFKDPEFYINGPTAGDVRQGRDGDCFLMAALCGLGNMPGLIEKVCVKHDVKVGVYGFVFYRDGEWQYTIVDDKLYLRAPDYDEAQDERIVWDDINRIDSEEEYRKAHQTGSRALYFAQCSNENETWLPLLEKAYAKAHGDYAAIDGGFTGEAVEDLTGGVTSEIYSTDIFDREAFWRDELMQVNKSFLFGCATGFYSDWLDTTRSNTTRERQGISEGHAYSIMAAKEVKGQRLLKVRNPWGRKEWAGKWSDGSSEWDAEWMKLLDHKFGNDGEFWISYDDLLKKYQHFDRTRIFGPEWSVSQCWTSVDVPWSNTGYHKVKFSLTLTEKAPVVIVLSQLDDTYFCGLEGNYSFELQFRLEDASKDDPNDYIVRSNCAYAMARSVSTDIELDAGTYNVLMKIIATKDNNKDPLEDLLPLYAATRREKLIQIGLSYDLAHAKGVHVETKEEKQERKQKEKEQKAKDKADFKKEMKDRAEKHWKKQKLRHDRDKARRLRKERADAKRMKKRGLMGERPLIGIDTMGWRDESLASPITIQNPDIKIEIQSGKNTQEEQNNTGFVDRNQESIPGPSSAVIRNEDVGISNPDVTRNVPTNGAAANAQVIADNIVQSLSEVIKPTTGEGPSITDGADKIVAATVEDIKPMAHPPPVSTLEHINLNESTHNQNNSIPIFEDLGRGNQGYSAEDYNNNEDSENEENESVDSFPSFHWNTDLDMPSGFDSDSSDASDSSSDSISPDSPVSTTYPTQPQPDNFPLPDISSSPQYDLPLRPQPLQTRPKGYGDRRRSTSPRPQQRITVLDPLNPDDDGPEDPWNAVCVVGLRVYSTLKPGDLSLKVIRPTPADDNSRRKRKKKDKKNKNNEGKEDEKVDGEVDLGVEKKLDPDDISKGAVVKESQITTGDSS